MAKGLRLAAEASKLAAELANSELKPCPAGHKRAELYCRVDLPFTRYGVRCEKCGWESPLRKTGKGAMTIWNKRGE